jgi:hypothetical protein
MEYTKLISILDNFFIITFFFHLCRLSNLHSSYDIYPLWEKLYMVIPSVLYYYHNLMHKVRVCLTLRITLMCE